MTRMTAPRCTSIPQGVVVWLTDGYEKLTLPDGKTQESHTKAGQVSWTAGTKHAVENLSDKPFEVIFVELKPKPVAAQPAQLSSRLTLLVFKDNSISAATDYWLEGGQLHYITFSGEETAMPLERVDLEMTAYLNWQRGGKFVLRPKPGTGLIGRTSVQPTDAEALWRGQGGNRSPLYRTIS